MAPVIPPPPGLSPDLLFESRHGRGNGKRVAGVDEVGRGPLAGPVVACAVILPDDPGRLPSGIADSKVVRPARREQLAAELRACCAFALGQASVAEIDSLNILQATFLAMRRALAGLGGVDHALIDGPHIPPGLDCPASAIVDGDARALSIAAASIIAKQARDEMMKDLAGRHKGYGWEKNMGYGSPAHLRALADLGPTEHHRRSFAPIARLLSSSSA